MMLKDRRTAAENVAKRLFATEQAIDDAISKMADLVGYLPIARANAHLSAVVGQDAISQAAASLNAMVEARRSLVATHNRLAETRDQIGLQTLAMGHTDTKPPLQAENRNIVNMTDHAA
ncbi:hypothetical protein [Parasphingorhabdus sp.]|uniref:hypothetical protein n=1 Tax=Parasphingorhabdus sp. TaxID=2709688 RepID=UPI003A92D695